MNFQYKKILPWVILGIVVAVIGTWAIYRLSAQKNLQIVSPNGKDVWSADKTYQINWKAKNIGKVGIILVKGEGAKEVKWIAKDIPAGNKKYDWQIFVWEAPGQDYKIGVFEYPWQEGQKIDYSDESFTISGPQFASCDDLSIKEEWPFLPNDYPNLKKVFITQASWPGNLEGLEGADKKCQAEAEGEGFSGTWKAFLGSDQTLSMDRLNLEGIFVDARSSGEVPEGKTCHRLLGKDFNEFFKKLSDSSTVNEGKFGEDFLQDVANIWLGRINQDSKRDCATVYTSSASFNSPTSYSFTATCQDWTVGEETVPGYLTATSGTAVFPKCYTPQGKRIDAVGLAGLSSGFLQKEGEQFLTSFQGKSCNLSQKLLCVQQ